jgi:hypothetical protein
MAVFARLRRRFRRKFSNLDPIDRNSPSQMEIVTPDQVPGAMDAASLMGVLPPPDECILCQNLLKLNHMYEWKTRTVALTATSMCFACEGETILRDNVLLHEVRSHDTIQPRPGGPPTFANIARTARAPYRPAHSHCPPPLAPTAERAAPAIRAWHSPASPADRARAWARRHLAPTRTDAPHPQRRGAAPSLAGARARAAPAARRQRTRRGAGAGCAGDGDVQAELGAIYIYIFIYNR